MSAVFISHSSADETRAREVQAALSERGIESIFLDVDPEQGIEAGADWERRLYSKLRSCRALVAINSEAYAGSKWCHTEIAQAKALSTPIFPVRIDDSDIHSLLKDTQAISLAGAHADVAMAYDRLARGLKAAGILEGQWDRSRPPYPGLLAFEAEDAPVFFGRERAVQSVLEKLESLERRGLSWLVLLGASGSGKSSLLRAGVLPRLERSRCLLVGPIIPGTEPFVRLSLAFSDALAKLGAERPWKELREDLRSGDPERWSDLATDLRAAAGRPAARVLIVVDQWEELLSCADDGAAERVRFAELLRALTVLPGHAFVVVATLRADFLGPFQNHSALRGLDVDEVVVRPIAEGDLPQVIEGPAQLAGVALEDGLVHEIIRDTQTEDALPLLAFALRELYEGYAKDELLELREYRELGGLTQSVAVAANRVLDESGLSADVAELSADQQLVFDALRLSLLALVRLGDGDQAVRRPALWDSLPTAAHPVLERFVQARLLVSSGQGVQRELRVTHEALFRSWPCLVRWLADAKELLAWRRRTVPLLEAWENAQRDSGSLLHGASLAEAVAVRDREQALLTDAERTFVGESEAQAQWARERERRRVQRTLSAVVAVALVILGVALLGWQQKLKADVNAQRAMQQKLKAEGNAQRAANATVLAYASHPDTDPMKAAAALREARGEVSSAFAPAAAALAYGTATQAVLEGHAGQITSVAISPDGQRILTGAMDNTARVRALDGTGEAIVLRGHSGWVLSVAYRPDGRRVVTGSSDQTARVWNVDGSGTPVVLKGHQDLIWAVAFSPDGRRLVTASADHTIRVWNADGGGEPIVLRGHTDSVWAAVFSPDGHQVLTGSKDRTARLWKADGSGRPLVFDGHQDGVRRVAFSPNGKFILTASHDGTALVWRTDGSGKSIALVGHRGPLSSAVFSPDGRKVVTGSADQTARVWNADGTGRPVVLDGHTDWVTSVAFSPDSQRVVTGSHDSSARLWNTDGSGEGVGLKGHSGSVRSVAFSPDGRQVVTGSDDSTVRVWPVGGVDEAVALRGQEAAVLAAALSPDVRRIAMGARDGTTWVWPVSGEGGGVLLDGKAGEVFALSFSPDGERIATGSRDNTAQVWNADGTGDPVVLKGHTGPVLATGFGLEGRRVVTGSYDGTARVWSADGEGEAVVLRSEAGAVLSVALSPDGERVVTGSSDGAVRVWQADGSGEVVVLRGHMGPVLAVALSRDGRRVLSGSDDHTARIWNADGKGDVVVLKGHAAPVRAVAFNSDDKRVVTGSGDQRVRIWKADGQGEVVVLEEAAGQIREDQRVRLRRADREGAAIVLEGAGGAVLSVAFSPDGERVVTGSDRHTARVFALDWRTQLWRKTPYCLSITDRETLLAKSPEHAQEDLRLCETTAARCRPSGSTFTQCRQGVEAAYGPLLGSQL